MDYVKVIDGGHAYASIAPVDNIPLWGASIERSGLPVKDRTYKVIKELDHPSNPGVQLMTIMDQSYRAFVIGVDGIVESTEKEFYEYYPRAEEVIKSKLRPPQPMKIVELKSRAKTKLNVGDIILITNEDSAQYGKRLRVTDPDYAGYDVVTSRNELGTDRSLGFKYNEFRKVIPEPELEPDEKPKFSKKEILEVINQKKSAEEIILDLMDHITN